jgi:dTDP-4-amino-4,6-dideoxygalactose transaminase
LDGLQAAILSVKLPYLSKWTKLRQALATHYTNQLSKLDGIRVPKIAEGREHVWHLYVIRSDRRDNLAEFLNKNGVQTVINYPVALPFLTAYKRFNHQPEDFPNAFRNQSEILSLPIYPELSNSQTCRVIELIDKFTSEEL